MQITREMWDQLSDEDKWFAIYSCQSALALQTKNYKRLQDQLENVRTLINKLAQGTDGAKTRQRQLEL